MTFYSFKGGVGRTVALLNTAWDLVERGHRVALLDLDLEAPGLHTARVEAGESEWRRPQLDTGFFEIVRAYEHGGRESAKVGLRQALAMRLGPVANSATSTQALALIPAHAVKPEGYGEWLSDLSWERLLPSGPDSEGSFFDDVIIAGLEEQQFDYFFIDGRTGLTDVRLVALSYLPDLVVFVTNLTDQSIEGTKRHLDLLSMVNHDVQNPDITAFRRVGAERRPIGSLVVASPLPLGELSLRQRLLGDAQENLGRSVDVQVDHLPFLAFTEDYQILGQHFQDSSYLPSPFGALVDAIVARNPDASENLLAQGQQLNDLGRWREALAHLDEVTDRNAPQPLQAQASLDKIRSRLHGLQADQAQQHLRDLVESSDHSATDRDRYLRARFHLAWTYQVLNKFHDGHTVARDAVKEAGQLRGVDVVRDRLLAAEAHYFCGQLAWLCDDFSSAETMLRAAASLCGQLGTAPLLHALSLAELVRVLVWSRQLKEARDCLSLALSLLNTRVKSSSVRGRVHQAEAELAIVDGNGIAALQTLTRASEDFQKEGDEIGWLETCLLLALITQDSQPQDKWKMQLEVARRLNAPLIEAQLRLTKIARGVSSAESAESLLVESEQLGIFVNKLEDTAGAQHELQARVCLERCRLWLVAGRVAEAEQALAEADRRLSGIQFASGHDGNLHHELLLVRGIVEVASSSSRALSPEIRARLQATAGGDASTVGRLDSVRASAVLALGGASSENVGESLASFSDWCWHLPIAFAARVDGMESRAMAAGIPVRL